MLMKRKVQEKLYDRLHRGVVYTCMGITVVSLGYLCLFGYQYYANVKPRVKLEQLQAIKDGKLEEDSVKVLES